MKTAIIFLPEAGIFQYLRSLCLVGDALKKSEYDVKIVDCAGAVVRCPMMPCIGIKRWNSDKEKTATCSQCQQNVQKASEFYGFGIIPLAIYVRSTLNLDKIKLADLSNVEYRGLKIGLIAQHDLMIECKVLSVDHLSSEEERVYREHIKNMSLILDATDRIIKSYKPSIVLTFNPYAQCQAVLHACHINGVKFCGITHPHHLGANWSLFQFTDHTFVSEYLRHCNNYDSAKDIPISKSKVADCFDDAIFRMYGSGSHIFSSSKHQNPEKLFEELGLDKNKKIIGVFTGSLDERVGIKLFLKAWNRSLEAWEIFKDQVEWLTFLRDFANDRNDIQIITRVHPREGRNGSSEHLKMLRNKFFGKDTGNFRVIWPDSTISSYDLFELIDCCLISSSTIGIECQRLGIPTLSYTTGISYPDSGVIETASSVDQYKEKLNTIINHRCTPHEIISSCRFYNWRMFVNSLDLGKSVPRGSFDRLVFAEIEESKKQLVVELVEGTKSLTEHNISELRKAHYSENEEKEAVKQGIRRIIDKLYFPYGTLHKDWRWELKRLVTRICMGINFIPKRSTADCTLRYSENKEKLNDYVKLSDRNRDQRFVVKDADCAIYVVNGKSYRRFSKIVLNLARIHEELGDCRAEKLVL